MHKLIILKSTPRCHAIVVSPRTDPTRLRTWHPKIPNRSKLTPSPRSIFVLLDRPDNRLRQQIWDRCGTHLGHSFWTICGCSYNNIPDIGSDLRSRPQCSDHRCENCKARTTSQFVEKPFIDPSWGGTNTRRDRPHYPRAHPEASGSEDPHASEDNGDSRLSVRA